MPDFDPLWGFVTEPPLRPPAAPTINRSRFSFSRQRPLDALKPTVLGLCIVGGDAQRLSCVQGSDDATRCIAGRADSTVRIWRPDAVDDDDKNRRPSKTIGGARRPACQVGVGPAARGMRYPRQRRRRRLVGRRRAER